MSTMIDVYHDEIKAALSCGDNKWLAAIAQSFCQRCHYYLPWKINAVRAEVCPLDGLKAHIGIEFRDGTVGTVTVGYANGKRRLLLNGEGIACESSADVVHALETPCAFFDGIYYAVEGIAELARSDLKEQIAKWDREANECRQAFEREFASLEHLQRSLNKMSGNLSKVRSELEHAIATRELVGNQSTWTICPVDFNARLFDAERFFEIPASRFLTLREAKHELRNKSGVYFGWRVTDGKCVYVGKSENLGVRLHPNRSELIDCKITYIEMPAEHIHTWELFFIWLHQPERNKEVREAAASRLKQSSVHAESEVACGW